MLFFPPFRLREQSDLRPADLIWTGNNGTTTIPNFGNMWTHWESILDYPRHSYYGSASVHPVSHTQITYKGSPLRSWYGGDGPVNVNSDIMPVDPSFIANMVVPPVSESVWSEQFRNAFNAFSDQFPEEIGLANFAFEARDMAVLLPKASGGIIRNLASNYLNWEFNIEPTIKDLQALVNLCSMVSDRIKYLKDTRGKPTRLRHNVVLPEAPFESYFIDQGYGGYEVCVRLNHNKTKFRAGAWLLQDLTHLDDFYGLLRAFVGITGLNNPLGIIWNALPFSFILDWFVDVSSYLDRFKVQSVDGQWDINNLTISVEQTAQLSLSQYDRRDHSFMHSLGLFEFRRYERITRAPVRIVDLPSFDSLNAKQLALMFAMLT